jgi:hypothetical protein
MKVYDFMKKIALILTIFLAFAVSYAQLTVTDFLPKAFVKDGSVNYAKEIQKAIDKAGELKTTLVFPAMTYLVDEKGLTLRSNLTLSMYGAKFLVDKNFAADGQVFFGQDIVNLNMFGGEIAGGLNYWSLGFGYL